MTGHAQASLEALIEEQDLGLEVLHPGGLETTRRLAARCRIGAGTRVLDVGAGTGESACVLAAELGADVSGIDASRTNVHRATRKAKALVPSIAFHHGDAQALPYADASFEVVTSECTLSLVNKPQALAEMVRVTRPGGRVGMHEICWKPGAPPALKERLAELEREHPESLEGWRRLFDDLGLTAVEAVDLSELIPRWMRETKRALGPVGQGRVALKAVQRWGFGGLLRIWASTRIFQSRHLGYGMVVGIKS
jgi:SAM-dependent methyltransferase